MNLLQSSGSSGKKQATYAPIFTNRFFQGLWTQRSPLRDASTSRMAEKYYGAAGDALIDGANVELSNRLTMVKRPGLSVYNAQSFNVKSFYSFRYYNGSEEVIKVMIDTPSKVYDATGSNTKDEIFSKSTGAGKSTFKSVGNTLFFGNGVEQKKWLTSAPWHANHEYEQWQFFVDGNNNVQQVTVAGTTGSDEPTWPTEHGTTVTDGTVTWVCMGSAVQNWGIAAPENAPLISPAAEQNRMWSPEQAITMPFALFDGNSNVHIALGAGGEVQSGNSAGTTGTTYPLWNDTVGGTTQDGTVTWRNCGAVSAWQPNYNYLSFTPIVDPNGNLQVSSQASGTQVGASDSTGWTNIIAGFSDIVTGNRYKFVVIGYFADGTHTGSSNVIKSNASHFWLYWNPIPGVAHYKIWCVESYSDSGGSKSATLGAIHGIGSRNSGTGPEINPAVTSEYFDNGDWYKWSGDGEPAPTNNTATVAGTYQESNTTIPTFSTVVGETVTDGNGVQPGVTWMCYGTAQMCVFQSYKWVYAYHCVDGHVSTASPITMTGPINGQTYVGKISGEGSSDPQCDRIWIFRTLDGQADYMYVDEIPNPGEGNTWEYQDSTPDLLLNIFKQAPDQNDPPQVGSVAPEYHLGRLFVAVGNVVYYSQSYVNVGVAIQSFPPLNYFIFPSTVTRMLSTSAGILVFTVSDIYVIQGNGISTMLFAQQYLKGIGLLNYHALDVNGTTALFFTSDSMFVSLNVDTGVSEWGFPIGDLLSEFDPTKAYVTWHVSGSSDKAVYICDGVDTWYRCNPTPAPESGTLTWSPKAKIAAGCTAAQSVEISPGVHRLLVGNSSGSILKRDPSVHTDNGTTYGSYDVIGSIVLAFPGQLAELSFITIDSTATGIPTTIGYIMNEALPYYKGQFTRMTNPENDPPNIKTKSLYAHRFWFSEQEEPAFCRHMQLKIDFGNDASPKELLSLTIFGTHYAEQ